jgi:hypothetical protein
LADAAAGVSNLRLLLALLLSPIAAGSSRLQACMKVTLQLQQQEER